MKRLFLATTLVLATGAAGAQQPVQLPDPIPLKLSRQMVQAIGNALAEIPYKQAAPILLELQKQLNEADQAARDQAAKDPKAAEESKPVPAGPEKPAHADGGKRGG